MAPESSPRPNILSMWADAVKKALKRATRHQRLSPKPLPTVATRHNLQGSSPIAQLLSTCQELSCRLISDRKIYRPRFSCFSASPTSCTPDTGRLSERAQSVRLTHKGSPQAQDTYKAK